MRDSIVCGSDGVQRRVTWRDGWWVVEDLATGEALSGGWLTVTDARNEARRLGAAS
jgi:hypothetical protein